jgi:hypothetical protein
MRRCEVSTRVNLVITTTRLVRNRWSWRRLGHRLDTGIYEELDIEPPMWRERKRS